MGGEGSRLDPNNWRIRARPAPGDKGKFGALTLRSTERKESRTFLRIRPQIVEFEADLGLKLGQTKPKIYGTVPTNRHTAIPNDSVPISECFDDDPILKTVRYFGQDSKGSRDGLLAKSFLEA